MACAVFLSGRTAQASTNVLTNPGFETGNLLGWTGYGRAFVESTNNTYYNGGNPGGSNVLTHSGRYVFKTFGQFSGGPNYNGIYQDVVAGPGSVWSAEGWALSHQQDRIGGGNTAWLEVTFRDATDVILALYQSAKVDAATPPNTWAFLAVTNELDPSSYVVLGAVTNFTAPAGVAKVRCQVVFAQPAGYDGGSVYFDDLGLLKAGGSDPDITTGPADQTKVVGQTATFTVMATGATTLHFQWKKGTDLLSDGGRISGATTSTLVISNVTLADAGSYSVDVSDDAGTVTSAPATLTVIPPEQAANLLVNASFETGGWSPWIKFGGGALETTNNAYYGSGTPVSVFDGLDVGKSYGQEVWNGVFQDVPATPGSVYTGDAWFLTAMEDQISGNNEAWLEVAFHDGADNILHLYKSLVMTSNTPASTWLNLPATNLIATWGDWSIAGTATNLVAPPGTAKERTQVTFHRVDGGGSIYFDKLGLRLTVPAIRATVSQGKLQLTFPTHLDADYRVEYKPDLDGSPWLPLATVPGDGSLKSVSDPMTQARRFYRIRTL